MILITYIKLIEIGEVTANMHNYQIIFYKRMERIMKK